MADKNFTDWIKQKPYLIRFIWHFMGNYTFVSVFALAAMLLAHLFGMDHTAKSFVDCAPAMIFIGAVFYTMNQKI